MVAIAGLGMALVAGTTLAAGGPPPPASGSGTVAAERAEEPTGRGGLPHSVPSVRPSPTAAVPAPSVAEAAVTAPEIAPTVVPVAPPPVVRLSQPCDVAGATAVTAEGTPVVCGGKGNGAPRWRKA